MSAITYVKHRTTFKGLPAKKTDNAALTSHYYETKKECFATYYIKSLPKNSKEANIYNSAPTDRQREYGAYKNVHALRAHL